MGESSGLWIIPARKSQARKRETSQCYTESALAKHSKSQSSRHGRGYGIYKGIGKPAESREIMYVFECCCKIQR